MTKERNTVINAGKLEPGDRFYKLNDRTKTALHVINTNYLPGEKVYCVSAALADRLVTEDSLARYAMRISTETEIVFLRNINNN